MAPPEIRDGWRNGVFIVTAIVLLSAFVLVKHASGNVTPQ
jgi:hypothetical protein